MYTPHAKQAIYTATFINTIFFASWGNFDFAVDWDSFADEPDILVKF
jgi:hypothetical protein